MKGSTSQCDGAGVPYQVNLNHSKTDKPFLKVILFSEQNMIEMYLMILHLVFFLQIYKSTKCNDMVQTGYCPRGPFCAFAHVERKLHSFYLSGSMCEIEININN